MCDYGAPIKIPGQGDVSFASISDRHAQSSLWDYSVRPTRRHVVRGHFSSCVRSSSAHVCVRRSDEHRSSDMGHSPIGMRCESARSSVGGRRTSYEVSTMNQGVVKQMKTWMGDVLSRRDPYASPWRSWSSAPPARQRYSAPPAARWGSVAGMPCVGAVELVRSLRDRAPLRVE